MELVHGLAWALGGGMILGVDEKFIDLADSTSDNVKIDIVAMLGQWPSISRYIRGLGATFGWRGLRDGWFVWRCGSCMISVLSGVSQGGGPRTRGVVCCICGLASCGVDSPCLCGFLSRFSI
jgi:hypothetical protein